MSSNVFMQKFFAPITADTVQSAWYVDEFGAVPAFAASLVAIYFWRKGADANSGELISTAAAMSRLSRPRVRRAPP